MGRNSRLCTKKPYSKESGNQISAFLNPEVLDYGRAEAKVKLTNGKIQAIGTVNNLSHFLL